MQSEIEQLKAELKAEKAKNKKLRRRKNISEYVKLNLKLYKKLIDFELSHLKEFKNEDGTSRYFRPAGPKKEITFYHNEFFQDLLEAKVLLNPTLKDDSERNARRSMVIDQLIRFFEKDRVTRPGAGRKPSKVYATEPPADVQTELYLQKVPKSTPKPLAPQDPDPVLRGVDAMINRNGTEKQKKPDPAPTQFVSPSPNLPKEMTTQQVFDYCRKTVNPAPSIRQDLIRHLIKDNAPEDRDKAIDELRSILGCAIPTIQKDLEVINQPH